MSKQSRITPRQTNIFLVETNSSEFLQALNASAQAKRDFYSQPHDGWESLFCQWVDYPNRCLPWAVLRAEEFEISSDVKTCVCCDPIAIQMTHRGAYCWGQAPLELSRKDALFIIAQINEQLMNQDECFYLLDNHRWLFTSKKHIELQEDSFERLIGTDLFNFKYSGKDGAFWQRLATEIQMLIKQLVDYKGLASPPQESTIGVHFWGGAQPSRSIDNHAKNMAHPINGARIDALKNATQELMILTDDPLIQRFCSRLGINGSLMDGGTGIQQNVIDAIRECQKQHEQVVGLFRVTNETGIRMFIDNLLEPGKGTVQFITQDKNFVPKNLSLFDRFLHRIKLA